MFIRHNILWMLWALFILLMCLMPGSDVPQSHLPYLDKFIHAFLYMLFAHLCLVGFTKQTVFKGLKNNRFPIVFLGTVSFGVLVEAIQGTVLASRSIEALDMLANAIGSGLGCAAFKIIFLTTKTKSYGTEKKLPGQPGN